MTTPIPQKRTRRRRIVWSLIVAAPVMLYVCRVPILKSVGASLNVGEKLEEPVDAVMVLGGGSMTRPFVAIEMVKAGYAEKLCIPDVALSDENRDGIVPSERQLMREIAVRSGLSDEQLVMLESTVDSTEKEARVAAEYLAKHPQERLAVVTNDYHTRRARWLMRRTCGANARRLVIVAAPNDGYDADNWWLTEWGLKAYINEFVKLGATAFK